MNIELEINNNNELTRDEQQITNKKNDYFQFNIDDNFARNQFAIELNDVRC